MNKRIVVSAAFVVIVIIVIVSFTSYQANLMDMQDKAMEQFHQIPTKDTIGVEIWFAYTRFRERSCDNS